MRPLSRHGTPFREDAWGPNPDWAGVLDAVPGPEGVLLCADPTACGACALYAPPLPGEGRVEHGRRLVERMARAGDVARQWGRGR